MTQIQVDVTRKFRFDKLEQPEIKRRRISSEDNLNIKDIPVVQHEEIVPTLDEKRIKYGQAWLQRCVLFSNSLIFRKCAEFVTRFGTFNDPHDLENQLETVLCSNSSGI